MLMLEVTHGPDRGHLLPLPPNEPQLIGRSSEALPLTDRRISRRHAELMPHGDGWLIRDLQSSNGTGINGVRLTGTATLQLADVIECGDTQLQLVERDDIPAGPAETVRTGRPSPPPMCLPPDPNDASRVLAMIWSLTAMADALDDIDLAACPQIIADGIDASHTNERIDADLLSVQLHGDTPDHLTEWHFVSARDGWQNWQRNAAKLAGWLIEAFLEAGRVRDRDRLAAMGRTVAVISHAVKNMLQGLQGGAGAIEMALNRGDLAMAREAWPILQRNLDRIHDLTFNMLAWSRTSHLDIEMGSLNTLICEIEQSIRQTFDQQRVKLEAFPKAASDVPFDPAAMHQAVLNLVLNALEAAPPRRGVVQLTASIDPDAQMAHVTVSDNGHGIDPAQHTTIFEPFASTRGQRGTGLGLAVTRRIAAAHGGRVIVDSTPGQGAAFTISLPLQTVTGDPGDTDIPPLSTPIDPDAFEPG